MSRSVSRSFARPWVCSRCVKGLSKRQRKLYSTVKIESPELYDVVCIGGGPAGLSLLTALRSSPVTSSLKVALIEAQDLELAKTWKLSSTEYSNRASSLTPSSRKFLESIGSWQHLDQSRVQPYHNMQVWDGVSGARIEFDWEHPQTRDPTIAYMTENANLVSSLLKRLHELGGVKTFTKTTVSSISIHPKDAETDPSALNLSSWPQIKLSNNQKLTARLLVGADGLNSPVRSFAEIPSRGWDYNRHGLVATLKLASDEFSSDVFRIAYQRFLPTGPIALLPLPGPYTTLVWSTTPELAAHLKSLSEADFLAMVNAAYRLSPVDIAYMHKIPSGQKGELDWRLQHTTSLAEGQQIPHTVTAIQAGSIASFPLRMRHADTYTGSRVALIGDAAHTVHPLAGQGLNMGIGDVEALSDTIKFAVQHGMDIGDQLSLESYNAVQYDKNNRLLGVVDKLHKLYSVPSGPIVGLRSLGLNAVSSIPALKEFFMRQASGTA